LDPCDLAVDQRVKTCLYVAWDGSTNASASQLLEGSPADRMIFAILMAVGLVVLMFASAG